MYTLNIMRTTVELKPEHRSALLALAAQRGYKGFSAVLEEAIEAYLADQAGREKRRNTFLSLAGTLPAPDAEELRMASQDLRGSWR
jgi:metal-responsive CopG/Arc/MetJ family transcriptional regulator